MSKSGTKFIIAGMAAVIAGFALGILFAPVKGSKSRKKLKKKMRGIAESLGDQYPENMGFLKTLFPEKREKEAAEEEIEETSAETKN